MNLVESFRNQQEVALFRERRLHIDAAAAQLETLKRLEMEREKKSSNGLVRFVDDGHIPLRMPSGPDKGGGGTFTHSDRNRSENSDGFSFGSLPDGGMHHVHFEEPAHSFAPPLHAFGHSTLIDGENVSPPLRHVGHNHSSTNASVMHYADAGLSMELRGLLNRSSLVDPYASNELRASEQSFTGSLVPVDESAMSILDIRSNQQVSFYDAFKFISIRNHLFN